MGGSDCGKRGQQDQRTRACILTLPLKRDLDGPERSAGRLTRSKLRQVKRCWIISTTERASRVLRLRPAALRLLVVPRGTPTATRHHFLIVKRPNDATFVDVNRLTKQEQLVLCIFFGLLVLGWAVKVYRTAHPPKLAEEKAQP